MNGHFQNRQFPYGTTHVSQPQARSPLPPLRVGHAAGETCSSTEATIPPSDDSVSCLLESYLQHKNDHNLPKMKQQSRKIEQSVDSTSPWLQDLEIILSRQSGSSALNQLCENRDHLNVSAPFKLTAKTFSTLESSFLANEGVDTEDVGAEQQPFCLNCLRRMDSSNASMVFSTMPPSSSYTPAGYEELHAPAIDVEEEPLYLIEVQDAWTEENGHARLEDFAFLDSLQRSSIVSLSLKIISSSKLIEILSRSHSYQGLRVALVSEESLSLPRVVGAGRHAETKSLVAVVFRNSNPDGFVYPSFDDPEDDTEHPDEGVVVMKFSRQMVQPSGQLPNLFSSSLSYTQSFVGRHYCFKEMEKERSAGASEHLTSSKELLKLAVRNADKFVPLHKRLQWDAVPHAVISMNHSSHEASQLSLLRLTPILRRSPYDVAVANAVFYISLAFGYRFFIIPHLEGGVFMRALGNKQRMLKHNQTKLLSEASIVKLHGDTQFRESIPLPFGMEPNADLLERLCTNIHREATSELAEKMQRGVDIHNSLSGYVQRTKLALEIERLRRLEDMKEHDMYSIRWKGIKISPPSSPHPACRSCGCSTGNFECAFHTAGSATGQTAGRIRIKTKKQLESFPKVLSLLRPEDRLVANIVVPGVADNFPLVSVGDLVRFRFSTLGLHTEVIGEVADVEIKTETVLILLPPPVYGAARIEAMPYLQALLCTGTRYIDALSLIQSNQQFYSPSYPSKSLSKGDRNHVGLFDLRFGFLGGKGFEIASQTLHSAANSLRLDTNHVQLQRVLAPTFLDAEACPTVEHRMISEWVNPVNVAQTTSVFDIVHRNHGRAPYIIYGPAGTGKSLTVCEAVIQVLRRNPNAKVLICAPSDAACDVLATRILPILQKDTSKAHRLLRINWWSRKGGSLPPSLLSCSPMSDMGTFLIPPKAEMMNSSVIVCQCFVAGCLESDSEDRWMSQHFTHLFIDETSQAMECEALVPLLKVGTSCSLILAGDPRQLGPTVRDPVAAKLGLGGSIQDRLMKLPLYRDGTHSVITTLVGNYRSHNALLTIPSNLFYNGALQCMAKEEVSSPYDHWGGLGPARFPMLLCNVHSGQEDSKLDTPSFFNLEECKAVVQIIQGLLKSQKLGKSGVIGTNEICVITPFRAQVLMLRAKLRLEGLGSINVGVVEDFQGQESSIVLISTVLTQTHKRWSRGGDDANGDTKLGFMFDPKRFNVAITRAHALCIIVGHATYLKSSCSYWTALIEHIQRNDGIIGADGETKDSVEEEDNTNIDVSDPYGISKLVQRVEELKLGSGHEENKLDLSHYYEDAPQWRVMLT